MLSQKHIKSGKVLDDLFPCDCPPLRGQKIFRVLNAQKADFLDFCTIPRTGNLGGRAAADRVKCRNSIDTNIKTRRQSLTAAMVTAMVVSASASASCVDAATSKMVEGARSKRTTTRGRLSVARTSALRVRWSRRACTRGAQHHQTEISSGQAVSGGSARATYHDHYEHREEVEIYVVGYQHALVTLAGAHPNRTGIDRAGCAVRIHRSAREAMLPK